jgi:transcriptional regulator with XRE-family HTH domain
MKVGSALRRALEQNEWSSAEAAKRANLALETLSAILTGRTQHPFPKTIGKLRNAIPGFSELLDRDDAAA